ncbi:MAG: AI-2E family transporter [Candidatus Dormibacteraeota bacterium]|nr:AI-2E family transporter [Candidatus Dormibacteraeota bacterium]MBV9526697.1 AI-2E family transporter [Candidatus Dormibacteraeota bacterium]
MATSAPAPSREAPQRERAVIRVRTLVAAALIVLAVVALAFLLSSILSILLVVLVAIVFAEGIRPLMHALQRRRVPAVLAVGIVYLGLLLFLGVMVALLVQPIVSEAQTLAANFPTYRSDFLQFFNNLESQFHFNVDVSKQVGTVLGAAQQVLFTIGGTLFSIVVNFFLVLVLGFLWLLSSERLKRFLVDLVPPDQQALAQDVIREVGFRMGGFVRAMAINSLVVGIATGVACALLRLPSPILLGIFAGLAAAVPVVGAFLGVVPPVLLGFTISPQYPILVAVVLLVVQLIDANTVVPLVMNRVVALPALAVVLALLIGGALAGVIGALLAVPIAAALQVVILRVGVPAVHRAQGREPIVVAAAPPPPRARALHWVPPWLRRP